MNELEYWLRATVLAQVVSWLTVAGGLILAFNVFNEASSTWLEV